MKYSILILFIFSHFSFAESPEENTKMLSRFVKPIPDSLWQSIASEKISETYEVSDGDTLYDISNRLFGDAKYWPKIWAVNNNRILNPHLIYPGIKIYFQSGSGNDPAQMGLSPLAENNSSEGGTSGSSDSLNYTQSGRSGEWKKLPRQTWEQVQFKAPPQVDPNGIDRRSIVNFKAPNGFHPSLFVKNEELFSSGSLKSSTQASNSLTMGDTVYIKSNESLKIGSEYSIVEEPIKLRSKSTSDRGYGYVHLGTLKITRQIEELYEASIINAYFPIFRKAQIVEKIKKVKNPRPTPGPSEIPGYLITHKEVTSSDLTQHSYAIVDRGSRDGITPGMIFRAYQYEDPNTEKEITEHDIIFLADFMVIQVTDSFSTVLGINSISTVKEKSKVVLLTDVSQYLKKRKLKNEIVEPDSVLFDTLDRVDLGDEINDKEKGEVGELEELEGTELFDDSLGEDNMSDLDEFGDESESLNEESIDDLDNLDDLDAPEETTNEDSFEEWDNEEPTDSVQSEAQDTGEDAWDNESFDDSSTNSLDEGIDTTTSQAESQPSATPESSAPTEDSPSTENGVDDETDGFELLD